MLLHWTVLRVKRKIPVLWSGLSSFCNKMMFCEGSVWIIHFVQRGQCKYMTCVWRSKVLVLHRSCCIEVVTAWKPQRIWVHQQLFLCSFYAFKPAAWLTHYMLYNTLVSFYWCCNAINKQWGAKVKNATHKKSVNCYVMLTYCCKTSRDLKWIWLVTYLYHKVCNKSINGDNGWTSVILSLVGDDFNLRVRLKLGSNLYIIGTNMNECVKVVLATCKCLRMLSSCENEFVHQIWDTNYWGSDNLSILVWTSPVKVAARWYNGFLMSNGPDKEHVILLLQLDGSTWAPVVVMVYRGSDPTLHSI